MADFGMKLFTSLVKCQKASVHRGAPAASRPSVRAGATSGGGRATLTRLDRRPKKRTSNGGVDESLGSRGEDHEDKGRADSPRPLAVTLQGADVGGHDESHRQAIAAAEQVEAATRR